MKTKIALFLTLILFSSSYSWTAYANLAGNRLGDKKAMIFKKYGAPVDSMHFEDGFKSYAFWIDEKKDAYVSFEVSLEDTSRIWSIRIAAKDGVYREGFYGVNLTTPVNVLVKKFGKPSEKEYLPDVDSENYYYENGNYRFEVHKGFVNSIKIFTRNIQELNSFEAHRNKSFLEFK